MGAAGLVDIKRRIKSVENTRKITNAMGLVATSKLRKSKRQLSVNEGFVDSLKTIINSLSLSVQNDSENIFFNKNESPNKLYIVITSETGLCGGFNGNVVGYLNNIIKDEKERSKVIVVGKKGLSYVKRFDIDTIEEYVDISDVPTVKECKVIFEKALRLYLNKDISEINVVYTKFYSAVKQVPMMETILPFDKVEGEEDKCMVEPDIKTVLKDTLNLYLKVKMRSIMLNSKCSEQSARMTAMDGATNNANDLLSNLNLKYNRIRQGIITQEISEIVGGASAQK